MAVNDKDPTEAILLVEQTIGTFNQIVVGQEGQMVPVPGYPDQPTLAERVKQNLKPSTDAAAGFAAQAASSAKAADDSAKLASQISGLETVADAIGLAALPLPDVWAPLSDSLRLITGYGRDVLVGSDVVARMVNFSRNSTATYIGKDGQLKTVAVNEPRFEKEGLLIEVQSSNIVTNSNVFTPFGAGATKVDNQPGPFGANDATRIDTANPYQGTNPPLSSPLVDGAVYTTSVWLRGAVGGEVVRIGIHNATIGLGVTLTTEWKRYSITQTRAAGTNSAFVIQAASAPISFFVYGVQLEALPFASSYIPTNGAAVTRVPDPAYLPSAGNRFLFAGFTVAFEWDLVGVHNNIADNRLIDLDNDASSNRHYVGVDQNQRLVAMFGTNKIVSPTSVLSGLCVLVVNGNSFSLYNNGTKIGTAAVTGRAPAANGKIQLLCNNTGVFPSSGHMRNLRIWHKTLSETQIKAMA